MSTPTPGPTLTGHRRLNCGCDLQQHGEHYTIQQCPLHAQAPALLEALRRLLRWTGKAIADGAFADCAKPSQAEKDMQFAQALLAQIEKGTT